MKVLIKSIPQDNNYNCLIPVHIQGKIGTLIARGKRANHVHGSIGHTVNVDGENFQLPSWAVLDEYLKPVLPI